MAVLYRRLSYLPNSTDTFYLKSLVTPDCGIPRRTQTFDTWLRRPLLYSTELWGHVWWGIRYSKPYAISHKNLNLACLPIPSIPHMEQVMGIEPTSSAWKADILAVVRHLHINGSFNRSKVYQPMLHQYPLVVDDGLEPPTPCL